MTSVAAVTAVLTEIPSDLFNRLLKLSLQTGQGIDAYVIEALEQHVALLESQHLTGQKLSPTLVYRTPSYTLDDMERDLGQIAEVSDSLQSKHDESANELNSASVR